MSAVRIQNVQLEPNKHIRVALQSIYGIGNTRALQICATVGVDTTTKVKDLDDEAVRGLQDAVAAFSTEGDLRREVSMRVKRLRDIGCYRGKRHRSGLPVRGQRTRTNARTRKGPRGNRISKDAKKD
ncbi:MAG: 30S ribosomal protein S13 [Gammaproteobacteria bacterium 39-13]|nr:30S ribosomal protein S13 [Gammaproteobacteria bacterium]OJV92077.1 MAG: 30S ribosomal protein S13 [Gammaproteobacteria bacterium 39-13]